MSLHGEVTLRELFQIRKKIVLVVEVATYTDDSSAERICSA